MSLNPSPRPRDSPGTIFVNFPRMSTDAKVPNGVKIAEDFNRLSRVYERYRRQTDRQTDRRTDGRQHIANVSSRSLKINEPSRTVDFTLRALYYVTWLWGHVSCGCRLSVTERYRYAPDHASSTVSPDDRATQTTTEPPGNVTAS